MVASYSLHSFVRTLPAVVIAVNLAILWWWEVGRPGWRSARLLEEELEGSLQEELPNFPFEFYSHYMATTQALRDPSSTCSPLPLLLHIQHNSLHWQHLKVTVRDPTHGHQHHDPGDSLQPSQGDIFLYSSLLDTRKAASLGGGRHYGPAVRLLAMTDVLSHGGNSSRLELYCQVWARGRPEAILTKVVAEDWLWRKEWGALQEGSLQPYMFSCPLSWEEAAAAEAVSLVQASPCLPASNLLRLARTDPATTNQMRDFGVCVKGLSFPDTDLSLQLQEWIEIHLALGVSRITLYVLSIHPKMREVLDRYSKLYTDKIQRINTKRRQEVLLYNDCLHRSIAHVRWVAMVDLDEVIVPAQGTLAWQSMMRAVRKGMSPAEANLVHDAYCFSNTYFFSTQKPGASPFFSSVERSSVEHPQGHFAKCLHNTRLVEQVHNHAPLACLGGEDSACFIHHVPPRLARLHHYKATCVGILGSDCSKYKSNLTQDLSLIPLQAVVREHVHSRIRQL